MVFDLIAKATRESDIPPHGTTGGSGLSIDTTGMVTLNGSVGGTHSFASFHRGELGGRFCRGRNGSTLIMQTTGAIDLNGPLGFNSSDTELTDDTTAIGGNITRTVTSAANPTDSFSITTIGALTLRVRPSRPGRRQWRHR